MKNKVLIKKDDGEICLVFEDSGAGEWKIPVVEFNKKEEIVEKMIKITGLMNLKLIGEKEGIIMVHSDDDIQENIDTLIGWFYPEDALKSVVDEDKKLLEKINL